MAETAERAMISVTLNGEARRVPADGTICDMLKAIGIDPKKVAVEHNREVIARSKLESTRVSEGDAFEIVHFVGGG